jgi:hypothetical protein
MDLEFEVRLRRGAGREKSSAERCAGKHAM